MEIKSLVQMDMDALYETFNSAFAEYVRSWTREEFEKTLLRNDYAPEFSYGAFDENKLVSFTFNAIGNFNGIKTAYDAGTGTLKEYRAKGLATKIFETCLPYFERENISQYLLEVLQNNTQGVSVYKKQGFEVSRELNYFVQDVKEIRLREKSLSPSYELKETGLGNKEKMMEMWDFYPSWQNSFDAISREPGNFKIIGAFNTNELTGYGILDPVSGDIPQLAVNKEHRRKGIATNLLKELLKLNGCYTVKVVNTDVSCSSITDFLAANNIAHRGKQYEMIKTLK